MRLASKDKERVLNKLFKEVYAKSDAESRNLLLNYYGGKFVFETNVAGSTFTEHGQNLFRYLSRNADVQKDVIITLEREKDNQYDPNAIKVWISVTWSKQKYHVGYIPKNLAVILAKLMDLDIDINIRASKITGGNDMNYGLVLIYDIG